VDNPELKYAIRQKENSALGTMGIREELQYGSWLNKTQKTSPKKKN